jgi:hypothetical protein
LDAGLSRLSTLLPNRDITAQTPALLPEAEHLEALAWAGRQADGGQPAERARAVEIGECPLGQPRIRFSADGCKKDGSHDYADQEERDPKDPGAGHQEAEPQQKRQSAQPRDRHGWGVSLVAAMVMIHGHGASLPMLARLNREIESFVREDLPRP